MDTLAFLRRFSLIKQRAFVQCIRIQGIDMNMTQLTRPSYALLEALSDKCPMPGAQTISHYMRSGGTRRGYHPDKFREISLGLSKVLYGEAASAPGTLQN